MDWEDSAGMETLFYSYTMVIMLVCAAAATASGSSYIVTRNRIYLFVATAFLLYFFDLSFIFQTEYLNHGEAIDANAFYDVQDAYLKAILAAGILESLWLAICEYLGKSNLALRIVPAVVFLVVDFAVAAAMPESPVKQWCFYSSREAFLIFCFAFLAYQRFGAKSSVATKALVKTKDKLILAAVALTCCIIAENTFVILLWKPGPEMMASMLPIYVAERNFSENALVVVFAVLTLRRTLATFHLRQQDPPTPQASDQERYIESTMDMYCGKHGITRRERDVLRAIVDGKDNQNIASELHLAVGTVKSHTHSLFKKTGTKTRQELLRDFWKN